MRRGAKHGKTKVDAKRPRARKSSKNEAFGRRELEKRLAEALKREAEGLEQQTATSEILRVISRSPGDIQPVFDAIAANAARLCDAVNGLVIRFDGQLLHLAAHHNVDPARLAAVRQAYPRPPSRGALSGRAILTRAVVHVPDVSKDPEYTLPAATTIGYRSVLAVPMMHEGVARGTILVARDVVAPFSDTHIALIQTFADQAVIAIENVRLFRELEARNRDLTEALEQQTATSEILGVISSSPTDVQPVFESLVASAARLCGANDLLLLVREADVLRPVAGIGSFWESLAADFRVPLVRGSVSARSVIDGTTLHFPDLAEFSEADFPAGRDLQLRFGHRTVLAVPLVREGSALGTIFALRFEVRPFADQQIALLKTFADQAVIAIENVRLFKELEARNSDLTEALEQQTATSEILRVISSSPTDLQPVLDAVVKSAARFCGAYDAQMWHQDGESLRLAAHHGPISSPTGWLLPVVRDTVAGRSVLERRPVHVADIEAETEEFPEGSALARELGYRTILGVPLLREGVPLGAIILRRTAVDPFSDKQIELLKTFADQAVIAIENVRSRRLLDLRV